MHTNLLCVTNDNIWAERCLLVIVAVTHHQLSIWRAATVQASTIIAAACCLHPTCSYLHHLSFLDLCRVTDKGIQGIVGPGACQLTHLNLSSCSITDAGKINKMPAYHLRGGA